MLEKYFPLQNRICCNHNLQEYINQQKKHNDSSIETNLQESATSYNLTEALPYCPLHDHKND